MTRDDIIRMARKAEGHAYTNRYAPGETAFAFSIDRLERFATIVAAAEREACAKVCDARYMGDNNREDMEARRCAAAIRARKENT